MIWGVYPREVAISFFPATKRVRGNKTGPFDYLGQPVPLFGREFIENQKIESNYLGIEFKDGD